MKRSTRVERLESYYEDFAPDYVATWRGIEGYAQVARAFLKEAAGEGARVLDVGCGPGHLTSRLPPSVEVVGCDIAEGMLALARRRRPHGEYHIHDYHQPIPRSWGRFDAVLTLGTLEFCDDLPLVLSNLAEATHPGGRLLLSIVERRPGQRLHRGRRRPITAELPGVEMFLYTFGEQVAAIEQAGLLPRSYRHQKGWTHTEFDVDVLYALWDLERSR